MNEVTFKAGDKVEDTSTGKKYIIKHLETTYGIVDAVVIPMRSDGKPYNYSIFKKLPSLPLSCLKLIDRI